MNPTEALVLLLNAKRVKVILGDYQKDITGELEVIEVRTEDHGCDGCGEESPSPVGCWEVQGDEAALLCDWHLVYEYLVKDNGRIEVLPASGL